jgi:hypothetical protein
MADEDRDPNDEPRPRRRQDLDDEDDRSRRRRREESEFEATEILIPTGVSGYSIAACYLGLISCFLPVIGLALGVIALACGIIALRQRKKKRAAPGSYGAVTSDMRAIIGLVLGGISTAINLPLAIIVLIGAMKG